MIACVGVSAAAGVILWGVLFFFQYDPDDFAAPILSPNWSCLRFRGSWRLCWLQNHQAVERWM